jgi:hypothetical protein
MVTALVEFADAARFVPAGMQSTRFALGDPFFENPENGDHLMVVQAGSSFRAPPFSWGMGPCDQVTAMDMRDIDAESREYDLSLPKQLGLLSIGGYPAWHSPASSDPLHDTQFHAEQWGAVVDGRFLVVASSRALLEQALSRRSTLPELLRSHAPLPPIPRRFQEVLLCHARPGEQRPYGGPVCEGNMVFVTTPDRFALHMFAAEAPPDGYWQLFDEAGIKDMRPVLATHGSWREHLGRFAPGTSADRARADMSLVQWQLFGFVFWF